MATKHINDLKRAFYGGGNDAEYAWFADAAARGVSGASALGVAARDNGLRVPTYGLQKFKQSSRSLRRICLYGDSVTQGRNDPALGDVYADALRNELRNRGFNVHPGIQPLWNKGTNGSSPPWATAGAWAGVADTTRNLSPHAQVVNGIAGMGYAANVANYATWTRPAGMTVTEFDIWYVDHTGAAAEFSYSINGGSTWLPVATARPATATLTKFAVTGVSNPTDIRIRPGTAAGASVTLGGLLGIDVRSGSTGICVDNMGFSGAGLCGRGGAAGAVRDRTGDWGAWFDLTQPELVVSMFSNDIANSPFVLADVEAATRTIHSRVNGYADLVLGNWPFQWSSLGTRPAVNQRAIYNLNHSLASELGLGVLDFHERWGEFGVDGADSAAAFASGLFRNEGNVSFPAYIHPIAKGARDMGSALARMIDVG